MIHRKYEYRYRNSRALVLSAGKHIMLAGRIAAPLDRHAPFIESGLTALDDLEEIMPCTEPDPLPLDERGRRRAAARAQWFASHDNPLDFHDILDT